MIKIPRLCFPILFLFLVLGSPNTQAYAWDWPSPYGRVSEERVRISTADDIELAGKIYFRHDSVEPRPALVLLCPWATDISIYQSKARELADKGYVVLTYTSRGWWGSSGNIATSGPEDVADARKVIDWLIENPLVDRERIGMAGISLGGGTTLLAAAHDPRIRVVAVFSGWSDLMVSFFGNSTQKTIWERILEASALFGIKKLPPGGLMAEQKAQIKKNDIIGLKTYTDPRSPILLLDRYTENQTHIFISHNYSDFLFPTSDLWNFYQKLNVPKRIRLQPGVPGSVETFDMSSKHRGNVWSDAEAWFDRWLRPQEDASGVADADVAEMHITLAEDRRPLEFKSDNPLAVDTYRLFLQSHESSSRRFGRLTKTPNPDAPSCWHQIRSSILSGIYTGFPILYALVDSIVPIPNLMSSALINLKHAAVYTIGPFPQDIKVVGIPRIHLKVEGETPQAHIVAYLFKVNAADRWKAFSVAPYTSFDLKKGNSRIFDFELFSGFASIQAGERLALAFDTFEPDFAPPLKQEPFQVKIHTDGESYIDLPLITNSNKARDGQ